MMFYGPAAGKTRGDRRNCQAGRVCGERNGEAVKRKKGPQGTVLLAVLSLAASLGSVHAADYAISADLSFLKQAEDRGTLFKDGGQARPGLQIFKDHGYNWIRLRLFHSPTQLPNNLEYTLSLAKDAKGLGYRFLLNYHYSDTWADPAKQTIPKAWQGKSHEELVQAVFEYTRDMFDNDGNSLPVVTVFDRFARK